MKKNMYALMLTVMFSVSLIAGCSNRNVDAAGATTEPEMTVGTIAHDDVPAGGKIMVNFEGRVTTINDGQATLDSGKTVIIDKETSVKAPDGSDTSVAVDDYIQGYAETPDDDTIHALSILVTAL